jgi:hypothetical protein
MRCLQRMQDEHYNANGQAGGGRNTSRKMTFSSVRRSHPNQNGTLPSSEARYNPWIGIRMKCVYCGTHHWSYALSMSGNASSNLGPPPYYESRDTTSVENSQWKSLWLFNPTRRPACFIRGTRYAKILLIDELDRNVVWIPRSTDRYSLEIQKGWSYTEIAIGACRNFGNLYAHAECQHITRSALRFSMQYSSRPCASLTAWRCVMLDCEEEVYFGETCDQEQRSTLRLFWGQLLKHPAQCQTCLESYRESDRGSRRKTCPNDVQEG